MREDGRSTRGEIDWHHSIPMPDGTVTDGDISLQNHRRKAAVIPDDLAGRTVLDVGAWDGYFSFECERRGAERIVALDADQHGEGTAGFDFAAERLDSEVEYRVGDVLSEEFESGFDTVLCFGVLYHVPDPEALLDRLFELADEHVCIETAVFPSPFGRRFLYDNQGVTGVFENTTYYVPSLPWIRAALRDRGATIDVEDVHLGEHIGGLVPGPLARLPLHRLVPHRYLCRVETP